jgi:5-methylcytosine-specific restriction endonuclease McrA
MARLEFTRKTRQAALTRAEYRCEATGALYGFTDGQRCNCNLSLGVQFDHILPAELGGDNSLANCRALCVQCHKFKTRDDIKRIRKSDRQRDKSTGVVRHAGKLHGAPFPQSAKSARRAEKPSLPPKSLFKPAEERT